MLRKQVSVLLLFVFLGGCAALQKAWKNAATLFESDPVGATLLTLGDTYEAVILSAGRARNDGVITEAQLIKVRNVGNRFFQKYNLAKHLHNLGALKEGDAQMVELEALIGELKAVFNSVLSEPKTTAKKEVTWRLLPL